MPMAPGVYGEHAATAQDHNAATLARWILSSNTREVHGRHLQREVRVPGLRTAEEIRDAAEVLVVRSWLFRPLAAVRFGPRPRQTYRVNPRLNREQRRSPDR